LVPGCGPIACIPGRARDETRLSALLLPAMPVMAQTVTMLNPSDAITPTGPWGLAARAGQTLYIAGMRGIDPATNQLVSGDEARIRQAFRNMLHIARPPAPGRGTPPGWWSM
jgi:hypothetical protein